MQTNRVRWRLESPYLPDKVYAFAKRKRGCKTHVSKTEVVEYK